jgi:endonuclease/exonuclease/phosphatase family metal-dependent hydrolase
MKLVQVNIWCGKLGHQLVEFLKREQPDIVCMQEVNDLKGHAGPLFTTLDEIKEASDFRHTVVAPALSYRFMNRMLTFGNAIMSNLPMSNHNLIYTRGKLTKNYDILEDDINVRVLQHVNVTIGNTPINVLNHHGHYIPNTKLGSEETLRQMQIIADYLDQLSGPIILCGDFNLAPSSKSLMLINDRLINLSVQFGLKNTYNRIHVNHEVCDYIFVSPEIKVKKFQASDALVSDHKALILEFDL